MNIMKKIGELLEEGTSHLKTLSVKKGLNLVLGISMLAALRGPVQSQARDFNPINMIGSAVSVAQTGVGLLNTGTKIQNHRGKIGNSRNFSGDLNAVNRVLRDTTGATKQVDRGMDSLGQMMGYDDGGSRRGGYVSTKQRMRMENQQRRQVRNNSYEYNQRPGF